MVVGTCDLPAWKGAWDPEKVVVVVRCTRYKGRRGFWQFPLENVVCLFVGWLSHGGGMA